ncbi:MAG: hypothetical protein Q4A66_10000 [Eubacteriales bacterium]|nr:hypothetical protein [Eubacteriales bacterium]
MSGLQAQAEGLSVAETAMRLLRGEADPAQLLREAFEERSVLGWLEGSFLAAAAPIGVWSLCPVLLSEKGAQRAGRFFALARAGALAGILAPTVHAAEEAARRIALLCEGAAPVLATLLSAAGAVSGAALLTPMASAAAQLCSEVICRVTIPAVGCAGILAVCPAFSQRFGFSGLRRLLTGACTWLHCGMLGLYTAMLGMRGLLKSGADSMTMQTARYTVDSLLPSVGGDVADSLGLLIASARAVQGGVGVVCFVLLFSVCLEPLLRAGAGYFFLRLLSALVQPLGAQDAAELLKGFTEVFRAMFVAVICAAVLFVLLLGASVSMAGSIL